MLTRLIIRNFKPLAKAEIHLGNPTMFVGPNNSGKTAALQALALWHAGLQRWNEKQRRQNPAKRRGAAALNRLALTAVPVPNAKLLWRNLSVRRRYDAEGRQRTANIRIEIVVEGVNSGRPWTCGMEFDYANEASIYCRPLHRAENGPTTGAQAPEDAGRHRMILLHPLSGLTSRETRLDPGAVNVRIGEGRTAEVLRNICFRLYEDDPPAWNALTGRIMTLFNVELDPPRYAARRGELMMNYREAGVQLDLSCSGRGLQQMLLLLACMHANPGTVLLLDEPDAHLDVPRQRLMYRILTSTARETGAQIIAASHSEVLLNEATEQDAIQTFST